MSEVHAAEYCSCIYESGFSILSLHSTKAGAYKAMRKHLVATHAENSTGWNGQHKRNYYRPCMYKAWRVKTYGVSNE
jgi:hypothetical protein